MLSRKSTHFLTSVLIAVLLLPTLATQTVAKGKKGKAASSKSKGKSARQAKSSRNRSSSRKIARRGKRGRVRVARYDSDNSYKPEIPSAIAPDRIEVLEYGSVSNSDLSRWLNPPLPSSLADANSAANSTITPTRKINIDSMRVIQIQQALANRGFYDGETSGVYDQTTIEAMRKFQASNKIAATGYPTAHALKRLGLGKW